MRFNGLDLNLLLAFQILMEERSVTRAARRMNLSQPAMSAALDRLRNYFQDELLIAQGKQMFPTVHAESLIGPVRQFLADLDALLINTARFDPATTSVCAQVREIPPSMQERCPSNVGPITPGSEELAAVA